MGDDPFANAGEGNGDWGHDDGYEPDNVGRGDDTFQFEDMEMIDGLGEGGEENVKAGSQSQRKRQKLRAEPDEEEDEAKLIESKGPLAVFDDTTSTTQTQQQTQTLSQSLGEDDEELVADGGLLPGKWSKNTFKAVGVLRKELGGDKEEAEGKKVVFAELAEGVSSDVFPSFPSHSFLMRLNTGIKKSGSIHVFRIVGPFDKRLYQD